MRWMVTHQIPRVRIKLNPVKPRRDIPPAREPPILLHCLCRPLGCLLQRMLNRWRNQWIRQAIPDPDFRDNRRPSRSRRHIPAKKIKLDFYDTDIKNVFRILRSVSGLNFAVDKDVQGKVTLTLEKPVPWDQVLDLVLKMNGLGKKMEGNVVRIATLPTLRQEAQDLQDAIAARRQAHGSGKKP
jgi:hypothetical protein